MQKKKKLFLDQHSSINSLKITYPWHPYQNTHVRDLSPSDEDSMFLRNAGLYLHVQPEVLHSSIPMFCYKSLHAMTDKC
jgi:hypothetical protein